MNCPYCGNPMEKGKIPILDRTVEAYWIPEDQDLPRFMVSEKIYQKKNGVALSETPFLGMTYIEAHICRDCKKGVFEIPD